MLVLPLNDSFCLMRGNDALSQRLEGNRKYVTAMTGRTEENPKQRSASNFL